MKLSNLCLSIVASGILGLAVGSSMFVVGKNPTAVIVVPTKDGVAGGGLAIHLPKNLTGRQADILGMAYDIAKKDGHKHPQLLQGILLQESKAGQLGTYKVANPGPRAYFGVGQITLAAARDVLSVYPQLFSTFDLHTKTDDEIKAHLILDDEFNISIASKYLLLLQNRYGYSGDRLLVAYNRGPNDVITRDGDISDNPYVKGATEKLKSALKVSLPGVQQ